MKAGRVFLVAASLFAAQPALAAKKPLAPGERIDLNRASAADLMRLPGVGHGKAKAILAARAHGRFQRVDDVLAVKGISSGWLEKQRPHLSVGPTALPPSTAKPAAAAPVKAAPAKAAPRPVSAAHAE